MTLNKAHGALLLLFVTASPTLAANVFLGDSLTACFGHKPDCFAAYVSAARQETYLDRHHGGAQASDLWWHMHAIKIAPTDRVFYVTGTNDVIRHHLDPAHRSISEGAVAASIYWLGSHRDAVRSSGIETGEWANSLGGLGRMATQEGSTWSSRFDGDQLILGYQLVDGLTSSFSVEVDGKFVGIFSHTPPTKIGTAHFKPPLNSAAPAMLRRHGFGAGTHTVVITAHANPGNPSPIEWLWQGPAKTEVKVLTVPRMLKTAYGNIGGSDAAIDAYAATQKSIVDQAREDGLNIRIVDVNAAIVPDKHLLDGVHFNAAGHREVARRIEESDPRVEASATTGSRPVTP